MNLQTRFERVLEKMGFSQNLINWLRKSFKSFIITGINLGILTGLLAYWTDLVELSFNTFVRPIEFLKIIGFTFLSLIGIRIAIGIFRKQKFSINKKLRLSILLTLVISSFLYFNYLNKIYENRIENGKLRNSLASKIEPAEGLTFGTKANNLTYEEYVLITQINWFPELQKGADSISYYYTFDGFLPDYSFNISYSLLIDIEIDTTNLKYGAIEIDTIGNKKRIIYGEYVN
jgi:hypothetical protein